MKERVGDEKLIIISVAVRGIGRPTVVCIVLQQLDIFIFKYLRKLGEFQPTNYSQSQLAENYKFWQKTSDSSNVGRIFGSAGFI